MPIVTTDTNINDVLMQDFMNSEVLIQTINTLKSRYWIRNRRVTWHKDETSILKKFLKILIDDDWGIVCLNVCIEGIGYIAMLAIMRSVFTQLQWTIQNFCQSSTPLWNAKILTIFKQLITTSQIE